MHVLITGAASLLATAVPSGLPPTAKIRAVDAAFPQSYQTDLNRIETISGDLRDQAFVSRAIEGITHIVHLAPLYTRFANDTDTLDHATRGTYQLALAADSAGVDRFVLGSTLDQFADMWARFRIDETWRPRPRPFVDQMCAYLAEVALREVTRQTGVPTVCLRLGAVVDGETVAHAALAGKPRDPRWLHVDDAVSATIRALTVEATGWNLYHIGAGGDKSSVPNARSIQEPFLYAPAHTFLAGDDRLPEYSDPLPAPMASRPIRRVVVFGAGGPLGAAVAKVLQDRYELRLADIRPAEEAASAEPQSPGAPLPTPPVPPHRWQVMDIRDADQVTDACQDMDAIVNCAVLRSDPADAFRVNTIGAYHVMRAAVQHGVKRVVHTGPILVAQDGPSGFRWDDWIVDDVPARPGTAWVYNPSKLLGKEICRIYAEYYGLEVPALAFVHFRNPAMTGQVADAPPGWRLNPFSVSWQDAAFAIRAALEIAELPSPFEYMHIGAELPHGVYPMDKAKRILGWTANDFFEECYAR